MEAIHFGSFDDRFCGSTVVGRRFSVDDNEITCEACKGRDRLWLTPQGAAYVATLESQVAA